MKHENLKQPSTKIEGEPTIPTKEMVVFQIVQHLKEKMGEENADNLVMDEEPSTERYNEAGDLTILSYIVRQKESGEYMEYNYMLAGRHENGENGRPNQSTYSEIHLVYYDKNDMPYKAEGKPIHRFE